MLPSQSQSSLPALLFQINSGGLQLLNCNWEDLPGLTLNRWLGISLGGWRSLVPEEYHAEVEKLTVLPLAETYTVVEFPVYWQDKTLWLLVFAAAVAQPEGGRKVVGLVQDVTGERERSYSLSKASVPEASAPEHEPRSSHYAKEVPGTDADSPSESVADLCHDLSGPLTSILVNCEMLMEDDCPPPVRQKLEGIFSEAMHINEHLRSHRRAS